MILTTISSSYRNKEHVSDWVFAIHGYHVGLMSVSRWTFMENILTLTFPFNSVSILGYDDYNDNDGNGGYDGNEGLWQAVMAMRAMRAMPGDNGNDRLSWAIWLW